MKLLLKASYIGKGKGEFKYVKIGDKLNQLTPNKCQGRNDNHGWQKPHGGD